MLEKIIEYIKQKYNPLSIILYGSYANGTNNLNSDFDALVISYDHEQFHDTSFVNDIQLDVFVYPASYFDGEFDCNNFIQILMERLLWITRNEENTPNEGAFVSTKPSPKNKKQKWMQMSIGASRCLHE